MLEKLSTKGFIDFDFLCKKYFWNSFVNDRYEYIVWPKHNIYSDAIMGVIKSITPTYRGRSL